MVVSDRFPGDTIYGLGRGSFIADDHLWFARGDLQTISMDFIFCGWGIYLGRNLLEN